MFEGLSSEQGFYTSKDFLPLVTAASKAGESRCSTNNIIKVNILFLELRRVNFSMDEMCELKIII